MALLRVDDLYIDSFEIKDGNIALRDGLVCDNGEKIVNNSQNTPR